LQEHFEGCTWGVNKGEIRSGAVAVGHQVHQEVVMSGTRHDVTASSGKVWTDAELAWLEEAKSRWQPLTEPQAAVVRRHLGSSVRSHGRAAA
jgi:hypothetical protein